MLLYAFIMVYVLLVLIRPQEYPQWPLSGVPVLPLALVAALGVWLLSRNKRFDDCLTALTEAIDIDPECRSMAPGDKDLADAVKRPEFKKLLGR